MFSTAMRWSRGDALSPEPGVVNASTVDGTRQLVAMVGSLPFHVDLRAAQDTLYAFLRSTPAPPDSLKDLTLELGIAFPLPE